MELALMNKLIELVKPDQYLLEYLTYKIASTKNQDLIDMVKYLLKIWPQISRDTYDIVYRISEQIKNIDKANEFIILSQKLEFYEELYGIDIYNLIRKKFLYAKLYEKIMDFDRTNVTIEDFDDYLLTFMLNIQDTLEQIQDVENDSPIEIVNLSSLDNLQDTNIIKLPCFIPEIDFAINGFQKGLYMFAGSLGGGKSSMLLNMAIGFTISVGLYRKYLYDHYGKEPCVLYISTENTEDQTKLRLSAIINDTDARSIITNRTPLRVLLEKLGLRLIVKHLSYENSTMTQIEKTINLVKNQGFHPVVIVFDYLDEVHIPDNMEHRHKLGMIARFLRDIGVNKFDSIVITATQLNRKALEGKISLATLSESIEHAKKADCVSLIMAVKTDLLTIKNCLFNNVMEQKQSIVGQPTNPIQIIQKSQEYPGMLLSVQKNRYNLLLKNVGILTSPNSKIGFTSLVECLDFNISLNTSSIKLDNFDYGLTLSELINDAKSNIPFYDLLTQPNTNAKYMPTNKGYYLQNIEQHRQTYYKILKYIEENEAT